MGQSNKFFTPQNSTLGFYLTLVLHQLKALKLILDLPLLSYNLTFFADVTFKMMQLFNQFTE
jgi:hypothetical protein